MKLRRLLPLLTLMIVLAVGLTAPMTALAVPPERGNAQPTFGVPKQVTFGYVGAAVVGPRSYCATTTPEGGGEPATLCADVAIRYASLYRRGTGSWIRGRISNINETVFFTAPYARGWQWVWSTRTGMGVMQARDLLEYSPIR